MQFGITKDRVFHLLTEAGMNIGVASNPNDIKEAISQIIQENNEAILEEVRRMVKNN